MFRKHLPDVHWTSIESPVTGAGIPDSNGCADGVEFWVEHKRATALAVGLSKFQVAWHLRRRRAGGRTFIAVRLLASAGPRKGGPRDELFLYSGSDCKLVFDQGLRVHPLLHCTGGPGRWDWVRIRSILIS